MAKMTNRSTSLLTLGIVCLVILNQNLVFSTDNVNVANETHTSNSDNGFNNDMMISDFGLNSEDITAEEMNEKETDQKVSQDQSSTTASHSSSYSSQSEDDKEAKEDAYARIMDLFSEESDDEVLDEKSVNLANGFENFENQVSHIYRDQLSKLRKDPDYVFRDRKSVTWSALEQNSDPIFYDWFAFSLTANKIIYSLTHSLSGKFMEHSDLALSPKCMLSMLIALDEVKKQKLWVVKMLDTTGKPELHNILDGSIISLGGYDQCLAIKSPQLMKGDPGRIFGRYCLVKYDIPLPARPKNIGIKTQLFNFTNTRMEGTAVEDFSSFAHALYEHKPRVGFCIPSQCTQSDLQLLLDVYFKNSTMSSKVDYCYSHVDYPEPSSTLSSILTALYIPVEEMTSLQLYILTAYFIIILLVILGTIIDLWALNREQAETIKINKLSEHNLKAISKWNANRSLQTPDPAHSMSHFLPTPLPAFQATPSTASNYSEESPFFAKRYLNELRNLNADTKRKLFRQNASLSRQLSTVLPQPIIDELNKFTVPDSFRIGYWRISKKNKLLRSFIAFSIYTNGRKLFQIATTKNDALDSLHGIRVISMLWIVLTHTYLLPIKSTMFYSRKFLHVSESYLFQFIVNGWVLVDSFFFVGSLLVTHNQLRTLTRTNGKINLFRAILSRVVRLSPTLWVVLSLIFVLPVFVKGPLVHEYMRSQIKRCSNGWFLNILFINNWYPIDKMCLLHTWYLSADVQMYIASLFIIMVLYKWPKMGCALSILGIVISCVGTFVFTYLGNHPPTVVFNSPIEDETLQSATEIYTITLPHIAPYCLGILAGFILFKSRTYKIRGLVVFVAWITAISLAFTVLMWTQRWNRGEPWTPMSSAAYAGAHRLVWALALFWITFACSTSHGGFIHSFLAWNLFKFLSKLSFTCFLIHFLVIWARLSYARNTLGFSHYTMVCEYVVNTIFSLLASVALYICVELPSINLYMEHFQGSFEMFTMKIKRKGTNEQDSNSKKDQSSFWFL